LFVSLFAVLWVSSSVTPTSFLSAITVSTIPFIIANTRSILRLLRSLRLRNVGSYNGLIKGSLIFLPLGVASMVFPTVDRLILFYVVSPAEYGGYLQAARIANITPSLFISIASLVYIRHLYSRISTMGPVEQRRICLRQTMVLATIALLGCVVTILAALAVVPFIINVYDDHFNLIFALLSVAFFMNFSLMGINSFLIYKKKMRRLVVIYVLASLFHAALSYVLLKYFDYRHVPLSSIASTLFLYGCSYLLFTRLDE
jgi:O-antigen/teichoic acid export membrane protein